MALLTSAFVNNGVMPVPRILADDEPGLLSIVCKPATATRVKAAMRKVITDPRGTGRNANIKGLEVYGKTGTAQNPGGRDHSWFVCYAVPAADGDVRTQKPPLAIAVIVENAGFGSATALPVAVKILQAYYMNLE